MKLRTPLPADRPVAENATSKGGRPGGALFRILLALGLLVVVTAGALLLVIPRGSPAGPSAAEQPPLSSQGPAPQFTLTDQHGQRIRLSDFRGQVVLMTFFYAECPAFCPTMNLNFKQIREQLGEASRKRLVLLSISFDPLADTPERLKEYALKGGFALPSWYFLTGTPEEIAQITQAYDIPLQETEPYPHIHPDGTTHVHGREFSHLAQALLIDQNGEIRGAYLGVQMGSQVFSVEEVVRDIQRLLAPGNEQG